MRHHRTFDTEVEAREFAAMLPHDAADTWDLVTEVAVYERPTLYAMGKVFEEGCWAVSWIEYTL